MYTANRSRIGAAIAASLLAATGSAYVADAAADSTVPDGTSSAAFAEIEAAAREQGSLNIYTTVDDSISVPMFEAFNEEYPEITITHTLLVTGDAQARFASERDAGAPSADLLVLGDHLLYDDQPEWFVELTEENVPNITTLDDTFVHDTYLDFMSAPYVFAYNTDLITDPPESWEELLDPRFTDINGSLVDPRSSGAFMSGFAYWRELYGDEFLTGLTEQGFTFEASPSESREKVAAGALSFTAPGVGATLLSFIEAGAPVDYVTPVPAIALTHAAAINSEGESPDAALVFVNWLLTSTGQTMACAGQYQYLANLDDVENCERAPDDMVIQDAGAAAEEADEIVALLGLDG